MRARLRVAWRRLRDVPLVGSAVRAADRLWWARAIAASGLVDAEYYGAQRGWADTSPARAVKDYVRRGFRAGLSLNPLFDELIAGRSLPEPDRVPALYAYLLSDRFTVRLHPWWDAPSTPVRGDRPALETVWDARADATITVRIGSITREVAVVDVRAWALEAAHEWRHGKASRSPAGEGDLVVRLLQKRDRDYSERLALAATLAPSAAVSVGMVGGEPAQWVAFDMLTRFVAGVGGRVLDARTEYGDAVGQCVPVGVDGRLCVVGPRSDLSASHVRLLLESASPGLAVSPAELAADGTILAVGSAGTGTRRPLRILNGHPSEDLERLPSEVEAPLLSGPTFAVARADWTRAGGLDAGAGTLFAVEDLSLRLAHAVPGYLFRVLTTIVSTSWAREEVFLGRRRAGGGPRYGDDRDIAARTYGLAGFDVVGWHTHRGETSPRLVWRKPTAAALRWSIRISSPPGPAGAVWGDTHFARGLSRALKRRGQTVVIDSHAARDRPTAYLDDVTLVVRGPYRIRPPRSGTRIEWIISHPDQITRAELASFDAVFAASDRWSRTASARWGLPVTPLLECTDADQFYPRGLTRTDEIVFVGTARGIARPSVVVPIAAGIPVRVYGPDWRTYIPAAAIAADSIPNSELSERYETASIVLNDQWPAMQREGFIAMRPFDVVAAGGRVISEYVEGIEAVFGDAVPVFRTPAELLDLLAQDPDDIFPDATGIRRASERIRREHSFDARADELIAAVARLREDVDGL
ncbi:CgeB family protein [Microbacterium rhizomatis]|uniref:Glycosyltransferase n=1 Tax=Microbacterium rhizomatis TaxID=1631477 RepID=A0A5J5J8Z0_9MICO|nr:glycosyltransferase [Microbacterium rhizomatis]KAA9111248.1 glycosyltransferase [Microbacterium rhizomatis]